MMIDLQQEARLAETLAVLDDVTVVIERLLDVSQREPLPDDLVTHLRFIQSEARRLSDSTYGPPIREAVQNAQDLREAVGRYGFRVDDPVVATAWADLMTALSDIFDEPCFAT